MIIYIFMIIFTTICSFIAFSYKKMYIKDKKNNLKIIYLLFALLTILIPTLISGFRSITVGTDLGGTYLNFFNEIASKNFNVRDLGYGLINYFSLLISNDFQVLIFITSLIFEIISFVGIYRQSDNPVLSTLLFFLTNVFFISMNMIRQSIATSIFILSIPSLINRKPFKYFLINIIAFSIHSSAILYFPLYFIVNKKLKIKYIFFLLLIFLVFKSVLVNLVVKLLYNVNFFRIYFSWYINSKYNTGSSGFFSILVSGAIFIYLLSLYKNASDDKKYNFLLWTQLISLILLFLASGLPLMLRTSWLFSFPLYIYIPATFKYIDDRKLRVILKTGIIFSYCVYMVITIFIFKYHAVVPYTSVLFD